MSNINYLIRFLLIISSIWIPERHHPNICSNNPILITLPLPLTIITTIKKNRTKTTRISKDHQHQDHQAIRIVMGDNVANVQMSHANVANCSKLVLILQVFVLNAADSCMVSFLIFFDTFIISKMILSNLIAKMLFLCEYQVIQIQIAGEMILLIFTGWQANTVDYNKQLAYTQLINIQMQQSCFSCGANYDYFEHMATIICQMNHVLCRKCANQLQRTTSTCPSCHGPIVLAQHMHQQAYGQPYPQGQQGWQPHGQGQPGWQGQGNPVVIEPVGYNPNTQTTKCGLIILTVLGLIFISAGIGLIVLRTRMDDCAFWSYYYFYDCYIYGTRYCCTSSSYCTYSSLYNSCQTLDELQQQAPTAVTIGIIVNFGLGILMLSLAAWSKRRQRSGMVGYGRLA